ncbi:MAG: hypothetical protein ACRDSO_13350 [Pseudonocardiaceae bacterium]
MRRAFKWTISAASAVLAFLAGLWIGHLVADWLLPPAWNDPSERAAEVAFAMLLATVAFGISRWWAERSVSAHEIPQV